jgi:threonine dehydrogenase-like Zn-dependent dehydrogenase
MQAIVKAHAAPGIEKVESASVCGTDLHIFNWDPWPRDAFIRR